MKEPLTWEQVHHLAERHVQKLLKEATEQSAAPLSGEVMPRERMLLSIAAENLAKDVLAVIREQARDHADAVDAFWKLVDEIGWATHTSDFRAVRLTLMQRLSRSEAHGHWRTFQTLRRALRQAIEDYEVACDLSCGLSDDGVEDLCAHIIGLGRAEYNAVMHMPADGIGRAKKGDYIESFAYCIPSQFDFREVAT